MIRDRWRSVRLSDLPTLQLNDAPAVQWKPVRHHLGIQAFGTNAYIASAAGQQVVPEHDERQADGEQEHEELYVVTAGHAEFHLDGEALDAPAGTFVFVRDPGVVRSAVARQEGTTILAVGAQPGRAFRVSRWERSYTG